MPSNLTDEHGRRLSTHELEQVRRAKHVQITDDVSRLLLEIDDRDVLSIISDPPSAYDQDIFDLLAMVFQIEELCEEAYRRSGWIDVWEYRLPPRRDGPLAHFFVPKIGNGPHAAVVAVAAAKAYQRRAAEENDRLQLEKTTRRLEAIERKRFAEEKLAKRQRLESVPVDDRTRELEREVAELERKAMECMTQVSGGDTVATEAGAAESADVQAPDAHAKYRKDVENLIFKPDGYTWDMLHGQRDAIVEGQDIVGQINRPELYPGLAGLPDNVFLVGPSATGKGRFAKTVAALANCTFYCVDAKCFNRPAAFWDALLHIANEGPGKSIIYIDEVDSVLSKTAQVRSQNVQRLWESDESFPKILMMACTNNPDALPPAIRSRFSNTVRFGPLDADAKLNIMRDMFAACPDNPIAMGVDDWEHIRPAFGQMDARAFQSIVKNVAKRPARERVAMESDPPAPLRSIVLEDFLAVLTGTSDVEMTVGDIMSELKVIREMYVDLRLRACDHHESCVLPVRDLITMLSDDALKHLGATWDPHRQSYDVRNVHAIIPKGFMSKLEKALMDGFRVGEAKESMCQIIPYGSTAPQGCPFGECVGYTYHKDGEDRHVKACGQRKNVSKKDRKKATSTVNSYILGLYQVSERSIGRKNPDGSFDQPKCFYYIPEAKELIGDVSTWEAFAFSHRHQL